MHNIGLDRSGKTTQSTMLFHYMKQQYTDNNTIHIRYPNRNTVIGTMIDQYLSNKSDTTNISDRVIHMLFSCNRWESEQYIIDTLNNGTNIICDRYIYSGIAYTCAKNINRQSSDIIDPAWCVSVDIGLPLPDITIFIDIDSTTASQRGEYGNERYESIEFQQLVRNEFMKLKSDNWYIIDGAGEKHDIFQQILHVVEPQIISYQTQPIQKFTGINTVAL